MKNVKTVYVHNHSQKLKNIYSRARNIWLGVRSKIAEMHVGLNFNKKK